MAHIGSSYMRESAAAWASYTKALIGLYYIKSSESAIADKQDNRIPLQIRTQLKGIFYGHTGKMPFKPQPFQNTFFSRCARDAEILTTYGPAFFFNGNVPFAQLQNITKIDKLLFKCATLTGLAQRYKGLLPQVQTMLSDPDYHHPVEAIFRRNVASVSKEIEEASDEEIEENRTGEEEEKEEEDLDGGEEDRQETTDEESHSNEDSEEL